MELPSGMDPHDLAETGWGVIFSRDEDPAVRLQLDKLLAHRMKQAKKRYKELTHFPGESARKWLWYRHGESPGVLDPDILPYYLLIVGDPGTISFDFQYNLSVNHAVGRVYFEEPTDYARYAAAVVESEERGTHLARRATVFAVENDRVMWQQNKDFAAPLAGRLARTGEWELSFTEKRRTFKADLAQLLNGHGSPSLLLAFGHGLNLPAGHPLQEDQQGALVCQDWPVGVRPTNEHYFAGSDLPSDGNLRGLIAFLFADYSAGTPLEDYVPLVSLGTWKGEGRKQPEFRSLAQRPFIARLPQRLLRIGALAVVGRVDRGWTAPPEESRILHEFMSSASDSLSQLVAGHRLGHSLRPLARRYTAIAAQLVESMERVRNGENVDLDRVAYQWVEHNESRNLIVVGDPAVSLCSEKEPPLDYYDGRLVAEKESRRANRTQVRLETLRPREVIGGVFRRRLEATHSVVGEGRRSIYSGKGAPQIEKIDHLRPWSSSLEPPRRPRVFLSYAAENRGVVEKIRDALARRRVDVWIDTDPVTGIYGGEEIEAKLQRMIEGADIAIPVLSSQSVDKDDSWVWQEWRWILKHAQRKKADVAYIIPVIVNKCKVPREFKDIRYLVRGRDHEGFVDELARSVYIHCGLVDPLLV